jgi:chromosome condensin MukBEF MukE localization factor
MVNYENLEGEQLKFVREKTEFYEKFTDMKNKEKLLKVLNNRSDYV